MKLLIIMPLGVAAVVILAIFLYYQNNKIDITRYEIKSRDIANPVKIAHLSDLHSKPFYKVLSVLKRETPDIIAVTGDYVNDKGRRKNKMLTFARELCKICPVYYITGNHERRLDSFDELMQELKDAGFTVLLDECVSVSFNGNTVNILGLDENQASFEDYQARKAGTFVYKDVAPLIQNLSSKDGFKIILSHFPENFEMVKEMDYCKYDFDLQLSGHAHGGQFILPFLGPVLSPGQGFFPKYARGSFGTRPKLIISRGLGNAEFPFRLFNHPEVIIINLTKES